MTNGISRRALLALAAAGSASVAGCLGDEVDPSSDDDSDDGTDADGDAGNGSGGEDDADPEGPAWRTTTLEDVLTGEEFVIDEFDRPVLVEPFAVWCSTCLSQQHNTAEFHETVGDDVVTVNLNIDQNEDAENVREHAEEHGFDWRYAVAPPAVSESLSDEFGASVLTPPNAPVVLACPDGGARRLEDGVKSADTLESEVEDGC